MNLREKLFLQKTAKEGLNSLKAGIPDIHLRLATQKSVKEALNRLKSESATTEKSTLERIIAGEYTKAEPLVFRNALLEVEDELKGDITPIVEPFRWFMEEKEAA